MKFSWRLSQQHLDGRSHYGDKICNRKTKISDQRRKKRENNKDKYFSPQNSKKTHISRHLFATSNTSRMLIINTVLIAQCKQHITVKKKSHVFTSLDQILKVSIQKIKKFKSQEQKDQQLNKFISLGSERSTLGEFKSHLIIDCALASCFT